jgi:hypothetical protein
MSAVTRTQPISVTGSNGCTSNNWLRSQRAISTANGKATAIPINATLAISNSTSRTTAIRWAPSASVTTAVTANTGVLRNCRSAYRRSCIVDAIIASVLSTTACFVIAGHRSATKQRKSHALRNQTIKEHGYSSTAPAPAESQSFPEPSRRTPSAEHQQPLGYPSCCAIFSIGQTQSPSSSDEYPRSRRHNRRHWPEVTT